MPTINPNLVPTITPGNLLTRFTEDTSLNVRYLTPQDPVYFSAVNRPMADIVVRQLVLAKALDELSTDIGYLSMFPFLVQPQVVYGSSIVNIPIRLFWDMHVSVPAKWVKLRLARADRLSGSNGDTGSAGTEVNHTGTIRFIFTANEEVGGSESSDEIALFYADYVIDSELTFQIVRVVPATSAAVPGFTPIDAGEVNTVGGSIIFRTGDQTQNIITAFYDFIVPGSNYQYSVVNSAASTPATSDGDFNIDPIPHGTGILASSAYNAITTLDSDALNWVDALNYPFDLDADLTSNDGNNIVIPRALFREMDITAPAGDLDTGNVSGLRYPVWISSIDRSGSNLIFYFSTYNITDTAPSTSSAVVFAKLTLLPTMIGGQVVAIEPVTDLLLKDDVNFQQHLGRGHVVLSKKWSVTGGEVADFFASFTALSNAITTALFARTSTRVGAMGISRVPKYVPTVGQSKALTGSSARFDTPVNPSDSNRYVTEADEGLGDQVDLEAQSGILPHSAINRYGNSGTRVHKMVKLEVDIEAAGSVPNFYENYILPRLTILFERAPVMGDMWYNGVSYSQYNGSSWILG